MVLLLCIKKSESFICLSDFLNKFLVGLKDLGRKSVFLYDLLKYLFPERLDSQCSLWKLTPQLQGKLLLVQHIHTYLRERTMDSRYPIPLLFLFKLFITGRPQVEYPFLYHSKV